MPGITLAIAQARLTEYLNAEAAVLTGQSYQIAGRALTRADLEDIQKGIEIWDQRVGALELSASRGSRAVVPRPNF